MTLPVNRPAHYTDGNIEVIDFMTTRKLASIWGLGPNAVKYIARAGKKDPDKYKEDLQKAIWYIEHELQKHGS